MSDRPACRPCCIGLPGRRTPNRAKFFTVDVVGVATLTCPMHATMFVAAGGFALPLQDLPELLVGALSTAELRDSLQRASVVRREPAAVRAIDAPLPIVITVDAAGARIERAALGDGVTSGRSAIEVAVNGG